MKLPNTSADIWDIETLVMLVKSWGKNEELSLTRLQQKTMVLLAVASMWRIRSDIGRLQWRDVILHEGADGTCDGLTLLVRTPKECQAKVSKIGPLSDITICPVHTATLFIQRTKDLRREMDQEHTFFLGYIENSNLTRSIRPATAASWLKSIMVEAKIDVEKYPPHSIRAAAATKAVIQGIPIQDVKLHANWSLNTDTMERYYFRPPNQHQRGSHICEAIFSHNADNNSTSEVEGVSTVIGIEPTTADQEVDTDGTQDVLGTQPWKKLSRFFNRHVFSFLYQE
ncbi:hypothetical protein RO3G_05861 [Lichtheimia corymbifera JMRC:FSU:9682]|uniref:Tyr recombinase domain-containing protein n=2 Tax=Lichtheimia corymbifera JMRC:FSU:9682 TaxID=1263082 RepID=A0A068S4P9_9FUNG|nr:hypothetical protein RO3G_05861 [Lichtheimia corymbifera JMRC:FSU:9682]